MALPSWAKNLTGRAVQKSRCRLLLSSPTSITFSSKSLEVVWAASLGCRNCQKRVAEELSRIDDLESVVVHVIEKKVTVTRRAFSQGSSNKIAAR